MRRWEVTIEVKFDDDFRTNTTDVARVWLTTGDKPDDTMSVAVIVRTVSAQSPIHTGVHAHLCAALRKAVEDAMAGPTIALWTEVDKEVAEGGAK